LTIAETPKISAQQNSDLTQVFTSRPKKNQLLEEAFFILLNVKFILGSLTFLLFCKALIRETEWGISVK
jgi:hypothetical protein